MLLQLDTDSSINLLW